MSRLAISPLPGAHGADGGGACPACLLSHLIRNLSSRMVSLTDSLSPSCLAYRHVAALSHLLDGFSLASASQQQNHQSSEEKLGIRDNHTRRILPNSLVQLDILRVLMLVTGKLRYLLSTIAEAYGDEASEYSAYIASAPREESGLLDHTCAEPEGCFDRWFALFKSRKVQVLKKESTNVRMVIDGSELCNSLMEVVRNLLAFSDGLVLSYENLSADLSLTVSLMTSRLTSRQPHTRCSITAHMRMLISSFLYGKEALPLTSSNMEQETHHGDRWFKRNAEVIIERLLNAGGPGIVGLGGSRGLGKTCLISHIACDERVVANFPGGVIYLCVGFDPEITYLQAQIWKQLKGSSICYSSRITFSSPEEGTAALLSRTQESLPSLLVLDDIWDAAHVKPFLCFDSYDRGRVVVISHIVEKVLANWDSDTFVHILEPLDEGETTCLFCSVAGCGALQRVHITNNCTINCTGTRRLIEAIASIHYYRKVDVSRLSSGLNLLETDGAISPGTNLRNEKVLEASGEVLRTNEGRSGEGNDFEEEDVPMQISMDSASSKFYVFFDSLSEVHPCLQENLLDLSAFPKGKWVSTSTLLNLYYVSNRMDKKRILFMLCFLASRSLIEWKVEENVDNISNEESLDNVSNEVFSFHWRLADIFYDSVQGIIQNRLGLVSKSSLMKTVRITFGEHGKDCDKHDVHGVLDLLKNAASALDECSLTNYNYSDPSAFCEHKCSSRKLVDVLSKINSNSRSDLFPFPCVSFEDDQFIFLPGLNMFSESNSWSHGDVTKVVTKLSIVSADTEFPIGLDLSKLKVLLFNESRILKSIPDRTLKHMEQLVVLDLKECAVLKMLPDSVSYLISLEVLDLSLCTHLLALPPGIGKLRNLKYLHLHSCWSLTILPVSLGGLTNLMMLDLSSCLQLRSLPKTLGNLSCLKVLNLSGCYLLQCLPTTIGSLRKLQTMIISGCSNLSYTPHTLEQLINVLGGRTGGVNAVPSQLWKLGQIEVLHLGSLKNMNYLPPLIGKLQRLRHLTLCSCRSLEYLPNEIGSLFLLEQLDLSHTAIRKLPETMGQLSSLIRLCLRGCSRLLCVPSSVSVLPNLEFLEMAECWDFVMLPGEFGKVNSMPKLRVLDLSGCSIKSLPCFAKGSFPMLQNLYLATCQNLSSLPVTLGSLTALERLDLGGCKTLASLEGIGLVDLKQLQWFNLRNCLSLTKLPVMELLSLKHLKFLDVSGCTMLSPFPELVLQCAREQRFTLVRWGTVWH